MKPMQRLKIFTFLSWFLLLLASPPVEGEEPSDGEKLIALQSGAIGDFSYALYRGGPPAHRIPGATTCDLILVVRNLGPKVMRLDELTKSDFVLTDSFTKDNVTLELIGKPRPIRFGQSATIHLTPVWWVRAQNPGPQTGVLTLRADKKTLLSNDLVFRNIPLDSARVKK